MPARAKAAENMTGHMGPEEQALRLEAEGELNSGVELTPDAPPPILKADRAARQYWADILGRMDNVLLLDSMDTEILGIYCLQLSRRDKLQRAARKKGLDVKDAAAIMAELGKLEKSILGYAKDLGLTPGGRAQLAKKRSGAAAVDPDADLFGI